MVHRKHEYCSELLRRMTELTSELAEARRSHLRLLIKELRGYANAVEVLGVSRNLLSRLANPGQRHSRPISEDDAREFERRAQKPIGWMDNKNVLEHQEFAIGPNNDHMSLTIEEDIPPRSNGLWQTKRYSEKLFLEAWSLRLRTNAIRYGGLNLAVNVSIWRSGWLTVVARGHFTAAEAVGVARYLQQIKEQIHVFRTDKRLDELVIFPNDTVVVGETKSQDTTYMIDPPPPPPTSIHNWLNQRLIRKSERLGDLVAVFQVTVWGDGTLRGAFSGFPRCQDVLDVEVKLEQLRAAVTTNMQVHSARQQEVLA